jgi:hypothetical protein
MKEQTVSASNATPITLEQWVPALLRWYPLRHGVVVGASQKALQLLNAKAEAVTLFKANRTQSKTRPPQDNLFEWLIADQNGTTTFYQASLASENGLLAPQTLKTCWPGIQCVSQNALEAYTLDSALQAAGSVDTPAKDVNWLWVSCLPAALVLAGATQLLQQADVVVVRVAIEDEAAIHVGVQSVQSLLAEQGFVLCGIQSERNPHLGTALFVKDHAAACADQLAVIADQLQSVQQQAALLTQAQADLLDKLDSETKAKQAEAEAKADAVYQNVQLKRNQQALAADLAQNQQALSVAQAANAQHEEQLELLSAQLCAQADAHLADQRAVEQNAQAQIEQLVQEKEALTQACNAYERNAAELQFQLTQLDREKAESATELDRLKQTLDEQVRRQHLLEALISKAEVQLQVLQELLPQASGSDRP